MHLTIANKLYSSWSMRPWLVLKAFDIPFAETVIPLRQPDTKARIGALSPSGKVPLLTDGPIKVWESLAIIEYLAERFPDKPIWPREARARAHARAISNEMHGGFMPLRQSCPMNLGKRFATPAMTEDLAASIARVEAVWRSARAEFGASGRFLLGDFTAADAMYAPVVTRLETYSVSVADDTRAYMDAVLGHPAYVEWRAAAFQEPWRITDYEAGHTVVADLAPSHT